MATKDNRDVIYIDDDHCNVFNTDLRSESVPPYAALLMVRRMGSTSGQMGSALYESTLRVT